MSFLGGIFDSSGSVGPATTTTTTSTNKQFDQTNFATGNGTAVSSFADGNGNTFNNNITTLNADVANRAMDNMLTMGQDALLFGHDAQKQAYGFATGESNRAFSFASAANEAANATTVSAIGSASSSMDKALAFGVKQTSVALDSLSQSANMIKDSYADAKGRGALTDWMLMGAIAVAGLIAVVAVWKK